jgi:hypothetical protein
MNTPRRSTTHHTSGHRVSVHRSTPHDGHHSPISTTSTLNAVDIAAVAGLVGHTLSRAIPVEIDLA